jgi:hypothetical protein
MGWATHMAQWQRAFSVVQAQSEDKAFELVAYACQLYDNQPDWLKRKHPLKQPYSKQEIEWAGGGRIFGLPKGADKLRMHHPTIYVMDEAAFLDEAEACYNVAHPVAQQIIAISSAGPGWFGDQCQRF